MNAIQTRKRRRLATAIETTYRVYMDAAPGKPSDVASAKWMKACEAYEAYYDYLVSVNAV